MSRIFYEHSADANRLCKRLRSQTVETRSKMQPSSFFLPPEACANLAQFGATALSI